MLLEAHKLEARAPRDLPLKAVRQIRQSSPLKAYRQAIDTTPFGAMQLLRLAAASSSQLSAQMEQAKLPFFEYFWVYSNPQVASSKYSTRNPSAVIRK
jgi:hypothetical protein